MFRMNKLTDYGLLLMTRIAMHPEKFYKASELADPMHMALPTVSKVLKTLQQSGLLVSTRGAHGGYRLARSPQAISVVDVITALEGPIALTECSGESYSCEQEAACSMRGHLQQINQAVKQTLAAMSLADLVRPVPVVAPIYFHDRARGKLI